MEPKVEKLSVTAMLFDVLLKIVWKCKTYHIHLIGWNYVRHFYRKFYCRWLHSSARYLAVLVHLPTGWLRLLYQWHHVALVYFSNDVVYRCLKMKWINAYVYLVHMLRFTYRLCNLIGCNFSVSSFSDSFFSGSASSILNPTLRSLKPYKNHWIVINFC